MGTSTAYASGVLVGSGNKTAFALNRDLIEDLTPDTPVSLASAAQFFKTAAAMQSPWTRPYTVDSTNLVISGDYLKSCTYDALGCVRIMYYKSGAISPSVFTHVSSA